MFLLLSCLSLLVFFVDGASSIAKILNIPKMIIGIVLVGLATTAPEFCVSVWAAFLGHPEIALGNAVGSVICDDGIALAFAAINLRISISGKKRRDGMFHIDLPDIGRTEEFSIEKEQAYNQKRDYLKSAVNILERVGVPLTSGWDCTVKGSIPINSGTASSSALVVAWIKFLLESSRDKRAEMAEAIAELAFSAEVAEFKEPGGKMDHYASSLGNVISINFAAPMKVEKFKNPLKTFVLADSLIKKETTNTLGFIKSTR